MPVILDWGNMQEFWVEDADQMLDYINAAKVFGFQYSVERKRGARTWHVTVYTEKFMSRAQEALDAS